MNRTLIERAKCMFLKAALPKCFWAEAVTTASYVMNRSPTRSFSDITPEKVWTVIKLNKKYKKSIKH